MVQIQIFTTIVYWQFGLQIVCTPDVQPIYYSILKIIRQNNIRRHRPF